MGNLYSFCICSVLVLRAGYEAMSDTETMLRQRIAELESLINTPEVEDFMAAIPIEAAHQVERWGPDHDTNKTPMDWFWVLGYLSQKAAMSQLSGDLEKAQHHCITVAALCLTWHKKITHEKQST